MQLGAPPTPDCEPLQGSRQGCREASRLPPEGEPTLEGGSRGSKSGPGLREKQPGIGEKQSGLSAEQPVLRVDQPAHQQKPPPQQGSRDYRAQRLAATKAAAVRILLVTAHPDDECMFFSPTLSSLADAGAELWLLCLSTGARMAQGFRPSTLIQNVCYKCYYGSLMCIDPVVSAAELTVHRKSRGCGLLFDLSLCSCKRGLVCQVR